MIDDAAQAFGAQAKGRKIGTLAPVTTTSFFPAKPLGCYGDGGAVFTDDDTLADTIRSLRNHGQGTDRYDNVRIGMTGRLDTIQAAVLIEKLKIFPDEIVARGAHRAALQCGARRCRDRAAPVQRAHLHLGAVHGPRLRRAARRARRGAARTGHTDRAVLSGAVTPAGRLPRLSGRGRRAAGHRETGGRGHQPADACLSGRCDRRTASSGRCAGRCGRACHAPRRRGIH